MAYRSARIVSFVMMVAITLLLSGCGGDEDDGGNPVSVPKTEDDREDPTSGPQASALAGETFTFSDGAVFDAGLSGSEVQLTFGSFSGSTGPFTLTTDDATARGTVTLGSCSLAVTVSDFPAGQGPQAGATIVLDPCTLDAAAGDLVLTNASTGVAARSIPVAWEFPRHGIGTSWSLTVDDDYDWDLQVTERREYRGQEVLVTEVTLTTDTAENSVIYVDAETGNTVAYLDGDVDVIEEYIPHDGMLSFPMKVGSTWRATYTERYSYLSGPEGGPLETTWEEQEMWEAWEVVAYEEVTITAGTFMAFRVTRTGSSDTVTSTITTYWYAPEVGFIIKMESEGEDADNAIAMHVTDSHCFFTEPPPGWRVGLDPRWPRPQTLETGFQGVAAGPVGTRLFTGSTENPDATPLHFEGWSEEQIAGVYPADIGSLSCSGWRMIERPLEQSQIQHYCERGPDDPPTTTFTTTRTHRGQCSVEVGPAPDYEWVGEPFCFHGGANLYLSTSTKLDHLNAFTVPDRGEWAQYWFHLGPTYETDCDAIIINGNVISESVDYRQGN